MSVPKNDDGDRKIGSWEFHYKGWDYDQDTYRGMSREDTADSLFPKSRLGCLDMEVLKKLGMPKEITEKKNFLFFYQLFLPMCDTSKSGIEGDPCLSYYSKMEEWSKLYAVKIGLGGTYGHAFKNLNVRELVVHDGCIVRDGVRGGN